MLFPQDAKSPPVSPAVLVDQLSELGLIGSSIPSQGSTYLPGAAFMRLITFLGCSPAVTLDAGGDGDTPNQYFIEVGDSHDSVVAICGMNKALPRCPECRHTSAAGSELDAPVDVMLVCDQCGFRSPIYGWDWRHQAGFGRCWVSIRGVHEGEAVPGEKLLNTLQTLSGLDWNYAWCPD